MRRMFSKGFGRRHLTRTVKLGISAHCEGATLAVAADETHMGPSSVCVASYRGL